MLDATSFCFNKSAGALFRLLFRFLLFLSLFLFHLSWLPQNPHYLGFFFTKDSLMSWLLKPRCDKRPPWERVRRPANVEAFQATQIRGDCVAQIAFASASKSLIAGTVVEHFLQA